VRGLESGADLVLNCEERQHGFCPGQFSSHKATTGTSDSSISSLGLEQEAQMLGLKEHAFPLSAISSPQHLQIRGFILFSLSEDLKFTAVKPPEADYTNRPGEHSKPFTLSTPT
jgi:hypothetical protein